MVTINKAAKAGQYPMPKVRNIFTKLTGKKSFAKLDMSEAYTQLILNESSQLLAMVNTPLRLMNITCLPFGVSAIPAIFQCQLEELLRPT